MNGKLLKVNHMVSKIDSELLMCWRSFQFEHDERLTPKSESCVESFLTLRSNRIDFGVHIRSNVRNPEMNDIARCEQLKGRERLIQIIRERFHEIEAYWDTFPLEQFAEKLPTFETHYLNFVHHRKHPKMTEQHSLLVTTIRDALRNRHFIFAFVPLSNI